MTGALSPTHWLIILAVLVLLLGAKRLPDSARGLGKAMRIFKAETAALSDGDRSAADSADGDAGRQTLAPTPAGASNSTVTDRPVTVRSANSSETAA